LGSVGGQTGRRTQCHRNNLSRHQTTNGVQIGIRLKSGGCVVLKLDAFGAPAEVDSESFPYHHARILYTSFPVVSVTGEESDGAKTAHGSAINTKNADRWKQVWTYMLTETTQ